MAKRHVLRLSNGFALVLILLLAAVSVRGQTLLVLPFENSSSTPALDWLGAGLAELSLERLPGDGRVVIPREEWLAAVEKMGLPATGRFTRATMIKLGEEADADFVVFGSYTAANGSLTLTAQVLRRDPPALSPPMTASGTMDEVLLLHARLAWQVLHYVDPVFPQSETAFVGRQTSLRLDAFEQFIRGLLEPRDEQRMRFFREAARLEPDWADPAFALGQAYFAQRDWATALIWLSRVPPAHTRGLEAGFLAGICHLSRNDAVRAESAFAEVLSHGEFPEALNDLGVALMRQGKGREAIAHWQRATEIDPEETDYWFNLGAGTLGSAEASPAGPRDYGVRAFREVLRREPQDAEVRALLIAALERAGRNTEAETERENSSVALPKAAPRASPLSALRISMRLESAFRLLPPGSRNARADAARVASPGSSTRAGSAPAARSLERAKRALAGGSLDAAEQGFSEVVLLAPGDASVYAAGQLGLAEVYRRKGSTEQAVRALRLALWSREDPAARITLARMYIELKRPAEALTELRTVLRLAPPAKLREEAQQLMDSLAPRPGQGEKP